MPLRRRKAMVWPTSARGLATLGTTPCKRPVSDQIADIGHQPLGAGFDELIVVKLLVLRLEQRHLLGDHRHELAQRAALLGVAQRDKSPAAS